MLLNDTVKMFVIMGNIHFLILSGKKGTNLYNGYDMYNVYVYMYMFVCMRIYICIYIWTQRKFGDDFYFLYTFFFESLTMSVESGKILLFLLKASKQALHLSVDIMPLNKFKTSVEL